MAQTSVDSKLFDTKMRYPSRENEPVLDSKVHLQPAKHYTLNNWKHFMTGFEPPVQGKGRKAARFFVLTCLVSVALVLATTRLSPFQLVNVNHMHEVVSRSLFKLSTNSVDATVPLDTDTQLNTLARTPDVQFDNFSLILKGQRVFL